MIRTLILIGIMLLLVSVTFAGDPLYIVTAYCPNSCCTGEFADGVTASGHVIKDGDKFVAAPPEIPFHTILIIPGYGVVPVLDRGGVIKGNRLDVFFPTHEEALQWGVQELRVKIIGDK